MRKSAVLVALMIALLPAKIFAQAMPPESQKDRNAWYKIFSNVLVAQEWQVANHYKNYPGKRITLYAFNEFGERMSVNLFYRNSQHNAGLYNNLRIGDYICLHHVTSSPQHSRTLSSHFNPEVVDTNIPTSLNSAETAKILSFGIHQRLDIRSGHKNGIMLRMLMFFVGDFETVVIDTVATRKHEYYLDYLRASTLKFLTFKYSTDSLDNVDSIGSHLIPVF